MEGLKVKASKRIEKIKGEGLKLIDKAELEYIQETEQEVTAISK